MSPFRVPSPRRRGTIAALVVVNAVLLGASALALGFDAEQLLSGTAQPTTVDMRAIVPIAAPPLPGIRPAPRIDDLGETLARPLFRPDRRPFEAQPVAAPEPRGGSGPALDAAGPGPSTDLRLVGIVAEAGLRKALVRVGQEANGRLLGVGASVNGWRIAELGATAVTLTAGGRQLILKLSDRPLDLPTAAIDGQPARR